MIIISDKKQNFKTLYEEGYGWMNESRDSLRTRSNLKLMAQNALISGTKVIKNTTTDHELFSGYEQANKSSSSNLASKERSHSSDSTIFCWLEDCL